MILRTYFECDTCSQQQAFRVQIGHSNLQRHEVICDNCKEKMIFNLHLDQSRGEVKGFEAVENCILLNKEMVNDENNLPVKYVSNEIPVLPSEVHNELSFPAGRVMRTLFDKVDKESLRKVNIHEINPKIQVDKEWKTIKKAWNLTRNGKHELAKKQILQLEFQNELLDVELESALYEFIRFYLMDSDENIDKLESIIKYMHKIPPSQLQDFSLYYATVKNEHMRRYFDIFKDFFNHYSEFSQVRFAEYLSDDLMATSNSFENIKTFYGDCFEQFTYNLEFLACINNIDSGRDFDKFESMTLKKYNNLDKAKRANPLKQSPILYSICNSLNSKLRNASHHGHIHCEGDTVKYKLKNSQDYTEISYTDYLKECVSVFRSLCVLLAVEIFFQKLIVPRLKSTNKKRNTINNLTQAIKIASMK